MNRHVLIVDDDSNVRVPMQEFLEHSGFMVSAAETAEKAMDLIVHDGVHVVITDIQLPGMNGLDFTDAIKAARADIDVIVITGFSTDYSYEEAVEKGASDFIFKPVRFRELLLRLKRVLKEKDLSEERDRMLSELKNLAITDALTNLYNSRQFYNQLELEMGRSVRYHHPLSLMLFDIDHFKEYNDTYGHLEGDKVLVRIGQTVKSLLRTMDTAYRYGGEEFTVILPETIGEEAVTVGERIRSYIASEKFIQNGKIISVSVSVGIAQFDYCEETPEFVKRADQAMYLSKDKGRNQVSYILQPVMVEQDKTLKT
ncbi:MAG: GGDEF domain-containing response regulator [Desulfobacteraceae bacterium]|nr:GGDEF domain-containing response regulator [Desulfobacteraceae bacterium]MBU4054674.1 GGDEF domain-containing response regulator [Pseudomonadota bacterium]